MPRISDPTHGTVVVTTTATRVLAAAAASTAEITRHGVELRPEVPIGTRDPDRLTLIVDGAKARLSPGAGRYSRRSYRVDAWVDDVHYVLKPEVDGSTLCADGVERGYFPGPEEPAAWLPGTTPTDAAIGYALTTAFGVTARSLYDVLFSAARTPVVGSQRPIA
ncbi:hypothetical protein ACFQV2_03815 [Actinokineospora soli]|uniref:Uncharacterized protein n=1 Tax=Actinokineospora soli TaxID=1048753 RepID=A0ABW2TIK6_9PSEU